MHIMLFCIVPINLQRPCPWLQVSTVVLRGSTDNVLDDLERAVDDGVNAYKVNMPCTWHTRGPQALHQAA